NSNRPFRLNRFRRLFGCAPPWRKGLSEGSLSPLGDQLRDPAIFESFEIKEDPKIEELLQELVVLPAELGPGRLSELPMLIDQEGFINNYSAGADRFSDLRHQVSIEVVEAGDEIIRPLRKRGLFLQV